MIFSRTASRRVTHAKAPVAVKDAIALLRADHKAVIQLFSTFEKTHSVPSKKALVAEICTALTVHAQVEAEIFYPELKHALKDKLPLPEVATDQADVQSLIAQLKECEPDGPTYDAKVKVLSEHVRRQVKEVQTDVFRRAKASSLDMFELGSRMAARKEDLMARAA